MSLGDPRVRPVLLLSALVTLLTLETLRAAGPLLTNVSHEGSALAAVLVTLIVFALPAVTGPLTRWLNPTRATAAAVTLLVLLRLLLQLQSTPGFLLTTLTTAAALTALLLTTHHAVRSAAGGGIVAATGLVLGTALDAASRTAFASWDPLWRPGLLPWLYTIALAVLTLLALARTTRQAATHSPVTAQPPRRPSPTPRPGTRVSSASGRSSSAGRSSGAAGRAPGGVGRALGLAAGGLVVPVWPVARLGAVGLFLALDLMVFGSPAFVSSRSGIGLPYAGALLLLGLLLAIEAVSRSHLPGGSARLPELSGRRAGLVAAIVLVVAVGVALFLTGPLMVIAVLVAQVAAALVLARALEPSTGAPAGDPRETRTTGGTALSVGLVVAGGAMGLLVALVVVGYQALVAVGLDGRWGLVVGAALAGLASLGRRAAGEPVGDTEGEDSVERRRGKRGRWAVVAGVPAVLLVVPVVVLVTSGAAGEQGGAADSVRVVSWDVDGAVGSGGGVDAGQVADVLGRQRADVVLLQDVGRGAVASGGVDLVEYLGRALGMGYVWAPAGDGRTGTVVLARLPMSGARVGSVADRAGGSYAAVTVETTSGQRLRVVSAALGDGSDRDAAMRALLGVWGRQHPAVIGGALGAGPSSPEVASAQDAGLASAQDSAGQSGMATTPAGHPTRRPDWIFGTPDVSFGDFTVPGTTASNHRPLAVTARLG